VRAEHDPGHQLMRGQLMAGYSALYDRLSVIYRGLAHEP
jgi:hypothetical protein